MQLLSQRQFAEKIGRSHVWVSKLVKSGKLPTIDGKIPLTEGLTAYKASQQLGYEANREHGEKQRQQAKAAKSTAAPKSPDPAFSMPDDDEMLPSTGSPSVDKVAAMFNRAKLAEKTFQAKLKELDYKEKNGLLIPKEQVEADAAATAAELNALLQPIGPKIAQLCEGKTAREIEAIITEAINKALLALQKSSFIG